MAHKKEGVAKESHQAWIHLIIKFKMQYHKGNTREPIGVSKLGFTKKSNNDNRSTIMVENQDQIYIIGGKCVKE